MEPAPGTRLGPYEIVALIGAGGMGRVYKARDTRLERDVAVKVADERFTDRFLQEARTVAALNHPNICTLHDVGPNYLVMELIDGTTLADRIEQSALAATEIVDIARQVTAAFEEAHHRGVLHRDLKPGNIMLAGRRHSADAATVKVLDFGVAKVAQSDHDATRTVAGTVMGTPAYMAPEQVEGQALDERSEIFSFGAVLYEMLTRRRAFEGASLVDVLNAVVRSDPAPSNAPPGLDRIVRRCLQKEPAKRYQSMAELKAALETVRDSVSAKPIATTQPSIAVLPFADMSAGKDHEWFSDGLSEEIINALVQIPGLTVIARTSAFAFKGKQEDIRRIADVLGVTHVLEGSVRRAGDRVRITAQLIAAERGAHLWSERYDRNLADVFAIQDEIAHAIASTLKTKLAARRPRPRRYTPPLAIASTVETSLASRPPAARRYTPALPAYEAYLKARYHWAQATPEALVRSKHYYEQASAIDPEFAAAYVGLADHLLLQAAGMGITPAREAMPAARAAAERALAIDPSLSDAHAVLGAVACSYDYDWNEADRRFQVALAREPVPALARVRYGFFYLGSIGQPDAAVTQLQLALQDDPLNTMFLVVSAGCLLQTGRFDEATDACLKVVSHENNWQAYALLFSTSFLKGRLVDAATFAEKAYSPSIPVTIGLLAGSLARSGDEARADTLMQPLNSAPERYGAPRGLAAFHFVRGDLERVADWLEKSIEQRDAMAPHFARRWCRNSSRWPELARMMNLPV
jgi:TolB-like protein/tRNA A-37 threonylcarbamoyl transferase component Bud32